jgi:hypothetical protein
MGAWSHEPFGNDTANNWAYALEGQPDLHLVGRAIQQVLDVGDDYLDADIAVEAISAAEVLAKVLGHGRQSDAYTAKVDSWVKSLEVIPIPELLSKTRMALARILGPDSELRELWEESDDFSKWQASIKALQFGVGA